MTGFIQAKPFNGVFSGPSTTVATPYTSNLTAGSKLVMIMRVGDTSATAAVSQVSDATNGNWTKDPNFPIDASTGESLHVWTFNNSAGGVNPTVTIASAEGGTTLRIGFIEIGTTLISGVTDNSAAGTSSTAVTPTMPSVVTGNANDYLLSFFLSDGGNNASFTDNAAGSNPSSGWTNRISIAAGPKLYISDNTVLTTGTYTEKFTGGTSDTYISGMLAVKLSATAAVITSHFLTTMGVGT